jgi:protein arginine kinase activator
MKCERCSLEIATIHLTEIIKDSKSEVHLCEKCARDIGLNAKLSGFSISIPEMLTFLNKSDLEGVETGDRCKICGTGFFEYSKTGLIGCPQCYENIKQSIKPVAEGIHGSVIHKGKIPKYFINEESDVKSEENTSIIVEKTETLEDIKHLLEQAVLEENYENAAIYRDKIDYMLKLSEA